MIWRKGGKRWTKKKRSDKTFSATVCNHNEILCRHWNDREDIHEWYYLHAYLILNTIRSNDLPIISPSHEIECVHFFGIVHQRHINRNTLQRIAPQRNGSSKWKWTWKTKNEPSTKRKIHVSMAEVVIGGGRHRSNIITNVSFIDVCVCVIAKHINVHCSHQLKSISMLAHQY